MKSYERPYLKPESYRLKNMTLRLLRELDHLVRPDEEDLIVDKINHIINNFRDYPRPSNEDLLIIIDIIKDELANDLIYIGGTSTDGNLAWSWLFSPSNPIWHDRKGLGDRALLIYERMVRICRKENIELNPSEPSESMYYPRDWLFPADSTYYIMKKLSLLGLIIRDGEKWKIRIPADSEQDTLKHKAARIHELTKGSKLWDEDMERIQLELEKDQTT